MAQSRAPRSRAQSGAPKGAQPLVHASVRRRKPQAESAGELEPTLVYASLHPSFETSIEEVRSGLPYQALERLQDAAGLNQAEIATVVGIPERTLVRRKSEGRLTPTESDRVDRITRLLELATTVLEDEEKARSWLHRPNRALAGKTPLELLDTDRGVRTVEDILMRIEHGIYG